MKETNFLLTFRIEGVDLCAFVAIAPGTGKAKIIESQSVAFAARPDVFNMHLCPTDFLRCPAILTAKLSALRYLSSQRG